MGLFDLGEYKKKKARADKSATPARAFPVALTNAYFDGRRQKLRFEPVLLDGGNVFISFRPKNAGEEWTLMVGKEISPSAEEAYQGKAQQGFLVSTEDAFAPKKWLRDAVGNVEKGLFGRLTVKELWESRFSYYFFGSGGIVDEEDYAIWMDGMMGRFIAERSADYDPSPEHNYWAKSDEAGELLARLNADEFAAYLEKQREEPDSFYGLSLRWHEVPVEEKQAMLPIIEREIEAEVVALMRAVVWSAPSLSRGGAIAEQRSFQGALLPVQTPLWRRPRFFSQANTRVGEIFNFDKPIERRIATIWPLVAARFLPTFENADQSQVHPAALHWMSHRGAYIAEFDEPNAHEHLEARLLLRDFLAEKGVSLDTLDAKLEHQENNP